MKIEDFADSLSQQSREAREAQLSLSDAMRIARFLGASEQDCAELRFDLGGKGVQGAEA